MKNSSNDSIDAITIARALGCHQSNVPHKVLTRTIPLPARQGRQIGFYWRLSDIAEINPDLARRIQANRAKTAE